MITQSNQSVPFSTPGSGGMNFQGDAVLTGNFNNQYASGPTAQGVTTPAGSTVTATTYLYWLGGFLVFLYVLKYATEHEKSQMQVADIKLGVWNVIAVTLTAGLGFFVAKTVVNKYSWVPTPLVNLVNMV